MTDGASAPRSRRPRRRLLSRFALRLRRLFSTLDVALARWLGLPHREDRLFFLLIPVAGAISGLLGLVVHLAIDGTRRLLWGWTSVLTAATDAPWWTVVGVPLAGGLVVGFLVWVGRQPVAGQGMSILIEAVAVRGGKVPARPVLLRTLAAIATVGSGGALGREGPMIRMGAMISSRLALALGLPTHRVKILVGCGAAAGLAAAYNIPVGGALFAMEVILGNFALDIFGPIVIASVIATLIVRTVEGNLPSYAAADLGLASSWDVLACAGLGILGGVLAVGFVFAVRLAGEGFDRWTALPAPVRPVVGMGLLGAFAALLGLPYVLGSGAETVALVLGDELGWKLVLALVFARLVATGLTAGSGGSGGLFTPSLAVGALFGSAYGSALHHVSPEATASPGTYAAVGMAAVAAGTSHAPISAILILFELTRNYDLILPLMVASILASVVARRIYPWSSYTEALHRKGVDVHWRMEEAVLAGLTVADLMRPDEATLRPTDPYREVVGRFFDNRRNRLFVLGDDASLLGGVSLHDIKHALEDPASLTMVLAVDLMTPVDGRVHPGDGLHEAAEVFARTDYERLPVVDLDGRFRGVLAKRELLAVYAQEVLGRPALLATFVGEDDGSRDYVELPPDFAVRLAPLPPELVGRTLAEARLPQLGTRVLQIRRDTAAGEKRIIPEGSTVLRAGDDLVLLGPSATIEAFEQGRAGTLLAAAGGEGAAAVPSPS